MFLTEPESELYRCIPLYEKEGIPAVLPEYVENHFKEISETCLSNRVYPGQKPEMELGTDCLRIMKNISEGTYDTGETPDYLRYDLCDVDNDGTMEYVKYRFDYDADWAYGTVQGFVYRNSEEGFRVFTLEGITKIWDNVQLWFEEIDGTTYLFTVEMCMDSHDYLLRIKLINDGTVEEVAAYLLKAGYREQIKITEMPDNA